MQTGSGELPVKGDVVAADQQGHHHIRAILLDALDHRAEVDHVERDELPAELAAAGLVQEDFDPVGGDVPVIVIGGQRVELLAVILDRPGDQHAQLLRRGDAGAKDKLVADAAFVLLVVEVQGLVAIDDRAHRLARGAGDPAHQYRHLVLQDELRGVLGVELIVGLGVELDQPERPAQDAAVRVDVVDRESGAVDHRQAVDVDRPRRIQNAPHGNDVLGEDPTPTQDGRRGRDKAERTDATQSTAAGDSHGNLPDRMARRCCDYWRRAHRLPPVRGTLSRRPGTARASRHPIGMTHADSLLETSDLQKRFGGVRAVDGVDFRLRQGELRCLIGPNGAGKSTFFKLLSGQLRPSGGGSDSRGVDRRHGDAPDRARRDRYQESVPSVFERLAVHENLWIAARSRHPARGAGRTVDAVIERLGIGSFAGQTVASLAHGQRQWVEIGMVMARRPKLVLLDEPAAGMARDEVARTAALIREINRDASVIVVEHDMQFVRQLDALVTVFHQGRILVEDTMANIQQDPRVRAIYLGTARYA